ncbi:MAG: Ig-like domain-containing protein [Bacteroidaceae bacterium]|nr:Ig-like domain-containing protein [Bacteroidaceae bacterium]
MKKTFIPFILFAIAFLIIACANPGAGPDGGPFDEEPPVIVKMHPQLGSLNTVSKKVQIVFNENIKVENATEKVTISPPQIEMPNIDFSGKKINVALRDTLKSNTTYTIDFSDAIEDNNEGNPLGNFTYFFSTGETIDTLEVSGYVLDAATLEPIKGMLVGLHTDTADTAFTTKPFERVGRTDVTGKFSIKGIAPGQYRLYALNDQDNNYSFTQKGERIAFYDKLIVPSCYPDTRQDTLWRDTVTYDTILTVPYTHFVPDDIVLLAFLEEGQARHFLKKEHQDPYKFSMYFTAPSQHKPVIEGLNFDSKDAFYEICNHTNDSITYWLKDTLLMKQDTLLFTYTYEETNDSTQELYLRTDTLETVPRKKMSKILEDEAEKMEKWLKKREKRHKKGNFTEETPPIEFLKISGQRSQTISPLENQPIEFDEPILKLDTAAIHLRLMTNDTTFVEAPFRLIPHSYDPRKFKLMSEWRPGQKYEVHIDSAAVLGISGLHTDKFKFRFEVGTSEDFGSVFFLLPDAPSTGVMQLFQNEKTMTAQVALKDQRADFFYIEPGNYYARFFDDRNQNGKVDTGEYATHLQPEDVYYFHEVINVRANWDIEQTWRLNFKSREKQKPEELKKVKTQEKKQTARQRNIEREKNRR